MDTIAVKGISPPITAPAVRRISVPTTIAGGEFSAIAGVTNMRTRGRPVCICSREAPPYADAQALKGLSMLAQGLPRVKVDARDLDARMDCQIGTWLSVGPLAAGVPMGASHGIGCVLGSAYAVPHGYTSCVMLPFVMRWNKPSNAERQTLVAAAMGRAGEDAADVLDDFIRNLGLPRSPRDVQVGPEHFDEIARQAMATPWVPRNSAESPARQSSVRSFS